MLNELVEVLEDADRVGVQRGYGPFMFTNWLDAKESELLLSV